MMKTLKGLIDSGAQMIEDAENGNLRAMLWCAAANISATAVVAVIVVIVAWKWV